MKYTTPFPEPFSSEESQRIDLAKQITQPYPSIPISIFKPRSLDEITHIEPTVQVASLPGSNDPMQEKAPIEMLDDPESGLPPAESQRTLPRSVLLLTLGLLLVIGIAFYLLWQPAASTPVSASSQAITTSTTLKATKDTTNAPSTGGLLQVYAVGAVKNPGIYRLAAGSRVYQLLAAAGGPLPEANLVALNLAAPLSDGEEVYVAKIGETPPSSAGSSSSTKSSTNTPTTATGALVNINTASTTELRQQLHVSSTTANNIVNYRTQHGSYSSVDQLLQVISESIYNRIKGMVTV
jgi:competence protein ComEA